ncbi:MAG: ribosome rescue protein RqcH [Promethearchaeota archaeon]
MLKLGREFSNFDVFAIVKELDLILNNGIILNVFEIEDLLIIRINSNSGKKNLIVKKDTRINLTEYDYPIPSYPSQYIRSLRKFLKNRRILKIYQHDFDRIIIIELSNRDQEPWKFVIELFNKGNFLLLDEDNIIRIAKKYKKFRDRELLAKREYKFPKSQEINFLTINKAEFIELFKNSEVQIVRDLSRKIHISGLYSEEICHRSNVEKFLVGKNLTEIDYENLYDSFKNLRNKLVFNDLQAHIIFDQEGKQISVVPFEIDILEGYDRKYFDSFNTAVDKFFSTVDSELLKNPMEDKLDKQIKTQEKILRNQQEYLEELKEKKENYYKIGEEIFTNLDSLEKLRYVLLDAKKKGYSWEEINSKLKSAKMEKLNGSEFFEKIIPSTNQLLIKINENEVYIDLKKSIGENANNFYYKGKKADKKIEGTYDAITQTKKKLDKLELEKEALEVEIDFLIKKPKKKWYEKFRWFISTDGYIIIGGRDATSNEIIYKKYIDPMDIVFHTNFSGSPLVVVKNTESKNIPTNTIREAADFVASFSRAWKEAWGVVDTYYIKPDQISRSPPSGESLPKGSFMISGKKNFIKNAKTELAIGLKIVELKEDSSSNRKLFYPKIISGPKSAIIKQTENILTIIPSKSGGFTKGQLAKEIKSYFIRNINGDLKIWVKLLSIDEILLYLPSGNSEFKK